jgi:superfamily II DNA or RNA helicase
MKTDYSYQPKAAEILMSKMLSKKYLATVLAACPGAGKTTISQMVLNSYVAMFPGSKALVLTEGQNTLKNQYISELENSHIKINFSFGDFTTEAQVRVGLPQSISQLKGGFDLLIVDEAHRFYFAEMIQEIVKKYNPKHILLMTGSPTQFNDHNEKHPTKYGNNGKYGIHYISAEELQRQGVFSAVNMDVIRVGDRGQAYTSMKLALEVAKSKKDDLSKIMVACPTIAYAYEVKKALIAAGYAVSLSTSKNDQDDDQINLFKLGHTNALIVVGKGILGFNDSNITALFDFKSSSNLDTSYQLFARVLRKHPKAVVKSYYRIADKDFNKEVLTLHKMLGLMKTEIFKGFTGKNLKLAIG